MDYAYVSLPADLYIIYVISAGIFGLLIGSFLNVVIYRLPVMMERAWKNECAEINGECDNQSDNEQPLFNLAYPPSRCSNCGHKITWYENIPVFSWLFLGAKCSDCKTSISIRYPTIELTMGLLYAWCAWQFGFGLSALFWCYFCTMLVALAMIDFDTSFLPDDLTFPLLWGGILASLLGLLPINLYESILGAMLGYLSLWSVYWIFKIIRGKEGMGYGDFKLLAALGAWFGWQSILPIIVISSVIGSIIGISMIVFKSLQRDNAIPFGPYLAIAGFACLFIGSDYFFNKLIY